MDMFKSVGDIKWTCSNVRDIKYYLPLLQKSLNPDIPIPMACGDVSGFLFFRESLSLDAIILHTVRIQ